MMGPTKRLVVPAPRRVGRVSFRTSRAVFEAVKSYERKQLLERIDREGATVGAAIPERIHVDGERLELRSYVFEVRAGVDPIDPPVPEMKRRLRAARRKRLSKLEDERRAEALSWERGSELVDEIVGIDRALNAMSDEDTDIEAEMQAREVANRRRWRNFLETALGRDDDPQGRRR